MKKRDPLFAVAKSMSGVFGACLMPPEPEPNDSKAFGSSEELKAPSGKFLAFFFTLLLSCSEFLLREKAGNLRVVVLDS